MFTYMKDDNLLCSDIKINVPRFVCLSESSMVKLRFSRRQALANKRKRSEHQLDVVEYSSSSGSLSHK